jgi:hypothetical protein
VAPFDELMNKATVALWAIMAATAVSASCTGSNPILSPAPSPPGPLGYCPFGMVRAGEISAASLVSVMADHLPHWLPDGMGLVQGYGPEAPGEFGRCALRRRSVSRDRFAEVDFVGFRGPANGGPLDSGSRRAGRSWQPDPRTRAMHRLPDAGRRGFDLGPDDRNPSIRWRSNRWLHSAVADCRRSVRRRARV